MPNASTAWKHLLKLMPIIALGGCSAGMHVTSQAANIYGVEVLYDIGWEGDRKQFFHQEAEKLCLQHHGSPDYEIIGNLVTGGYFSPGRTTIDPDTRHIFGRIECLLPAGRKAGTDSELVRNPVYLGTGGQRFALTMAKTYILEVDGKPATQLPTFSCASAHPLQALTNSLICRQSPESAERQDIATSVILTPGSHSILIGRATAYTGPGVSHLLDQIAFQDTLHVTFSEEDVGRRYFANTHWSEDRYWSSISRLKGCEEGYPLIEIVAGEVPQEILELFGPKNFKCPN